MKRLVVFDLDGTLNRTELYTIPANRKTLEAFGITSKQISDEQILSQVGASFYDAIHYFLGEDVSPEDVEKYKTLNTEYENEFMQTNSAFYDGVDVALQTLKEQGFELAVCSNASERYIKLVLNTLGLNEYIDHIQPLLPNMTKVDTLGLLLERVSPDKAVMVGDRYFDKDASRGNNLPFIGCKYGFCSAEVADADIAVDSPTEFVDAVNKLI